MDSCQSSVLVNIIMMEMYTVNFPISLSRVFDTFWVSRWVGGAYSRGGTIQGGLINLSDTCRIKSQCQSTTCIHVCL